MTDQMNTILIKFNGQIIKTQLGIEEGFTGETTTIFHWKDGKILKAEVVRRAAIDLNYPKDTG